MRIVNWYTEDLFFKPLFGGDGEGDGDADVDVEGEDETEDSDEFGDSDDDSDDSDGSDDDESDESDEDDEDEDVDYRAEARGLRRANRRLERDLEDALEMLEQYEAEGKTPEAVDEMISDLKEENEALTALLNGHYVKNAISTFKYDWVDIDDVFDALDADEIDIDIETGEIDGLEDQLAEIASRKPHWLKKKESRRESRDRSTGSGPTNSGRRSAGKKTAEDWAKENNAYSILTR